MKTKLLRKLRSRIIPADFYNRYVEIKYYDKHDNVAHYRVFSKDDLLYIIRNMFDDYVANSIKDKNYKTSLKRCKKEGNQPIKYTWNNE